MCGYYASILNIHYSLSTTVLGLTFRVSVFPACDVWPVGMSTVGCFELHTEIPRKQY